MPRGFSHRGASSHLRITHTSALLAQGRPACYPRNADDPESCRKDQTFGPGPYKSRRTRRTNRRVASGKFLSQLGPRTAIIMANETERYPRRSGWPTALFGIILVLISLYLLFGGIRLGLLGGSWYYLIAGVAMLLSGFLYIKRKLAGAWLFAALSIGTIIWALFEVGLDFWGLVPRLAPFAVLGIFAAALVPRLRNAPCRVSSAIAVLLLLVTIAGGAAMFMPHDVVSNPVELAQAPAIDDPADPENVWKYYGRTMAGTRYAPFDQINRDNVDQLEVAWTFRTGEEAIDGSEDQITPIHVGDTIYLCTPLNKVFAMNAETGEQRWMFDPKIESTKAWNRCRGVAYYEPGAAATAPPAATATPTGDATVATAETSSGATADAGAAADANADSATAASTAERAASAQSPV